MSSSRYDLLVGSLLEDGLTSAEADELAAIVREDPGLRLDLQRQLVLWELWSQSQAPERSTDSFLAAIRTRIRAESESGRESFIAALKRRLPRATHDAHPRDPVRWSRSRRAAWLVPAVALLVMALVWVTAPRTAEATTLHGEAVCTACILHESHDHFPALRIREGETTRVVHLEIDPSLVPPIGNFCAAPVPVDVSGRVHRENGQLILAVRALARVGGPATPNEPTGPPENERILFPF